MSQAGYTPIQLYYSTTAAAVPTAGNLASGELAINITDGKLYYKNNSGTVTLLAGAGGAITPITNNGVVYVNSSGQATSGSALTFDGTNLALTTTGAIYKVPTAGGSLFDAGGNNGIYILGSSNYVATYVAGSEQMRLTSTGLGIGTSSPSQKLTVAGAINLSADATNPNSGVSLWSQAGIGATLSGFNIAFNTGSNGAQTERMRLDSSGNLGIGTTGPITKLQVNSGSSYVAGFKSTVANGFIALQDSGTSGALTDGNVAIGAISDDLAFRSGGATRMRLGSAGQLGVGLTPTNNSYLIQSNSGVRAGTSVLAQGSLNAYTGAGLFMSYESTYGRLEAYDYATPGYKDIGISPNGGNVGVGMVGSSTYGKLSVNGNIAQYGSVASGSELGRIAWFNTATGYDVASIRTFIGAGQINRGEIGFYTNTGAVQALALYIDRVQQVGIGTNLPSTNLTIGGTAASGGASGSLGTFLSRGVTTNFYEAFDGTKSFIAGVDNTQGYAKVGTLSQHPVALVAGNGSGFLYLTTSSNVSIGTTNSFNIITLPAASNGQGISWDNYANVFGEFSSGATYLSSNYYPTPGAAGYKTTITATYGAAGMSLNGTGGAGNGGLIQFFVNSATAKTAGAAFTPTEVARIDQSGNLLVGTTSAGGKLTINNTSQVVDWAIGCYNVEDSPSSSNYYYIDFRTSALFQTGYIWSNGGTTTSYATSSDYRLKENIAPITGALAKVAQLKPSTWSWKINGQDGQGFIAHELQAVCPDAVSGEKDGLDKDGNPRYQAVDTSFLVATLTAAIQEQQAIIESLKARLDAANL